MNEPTIPPKVAEHLGYYVYLYVDPRTDKPFYVGKGVGSRVLAHLGASGDSQKIRTIQDLRAAGLEPRLDILAHGIRNEETALRIEAACIDLLGLDELTNQVRGWKSIQFGRMTLRELTAYYAAESVEVTHPSLLIRINRLYRHSMSREELYEATRGVWKIGRRREVAEYAMAVFEGVVKEVYSIEAWHPGGTTEYRTRDINSSKRWEFTGTVAEDNIREKYRDKSVSKYFPRSQQSPVVYVNC